MFHHCKNESQTLEVCRWEYFHVHITVYASQQIPRHSRTLKFKLKFPGLSRTNIIFQDYPGLESLFLKFQYFLGGVGSLLITMSRLPALNYNTKQYSYNLLLHDTAGWMVTSQSLCWLPLSALCYWWYAKQNAELQWHSCKPLTTNFSPRQSIPHQVQPPSSWSLPSLQHEYMKFHINKQWLVTIVETQGTEWYQDSTFPGLFASRSRNSIKGGKVPWNWVNVSETNLY